jgi:hypothetical protein
MATETYALSIQGVHKQERNECVISYKGDGLTANDTFNSGLDLIDSWEGNLMALWVAMLPTSYYVERLSARRIHPIGISQVYHRQYQSTDHPGTVSGVAQSQQLCPAIQLIPPLGVKSGGRMFLPCIAKGSIDSNAYSGAYLTAVDDWIAGQLSNFGVNAIQWTLAIYSRKLDATSNVVAYNLSPRIGYQARRRSPV